jgi:hypothetical protein
MVTAAGTVATAVLLLDNEMFSTVEAADVSVTVPWVVVPGTTLAAFSATADRAGVPLAGAAGELPHWTVTMAATSMLASDTNAREGWVVVKKLPLVMAQTCRSQRGARPVPV